MSTLAPRTCLPSPVRLFSRLTAAFGLATVLTVAGVSAPANAKANDNAKSPGSAEILVIGDSQISFGSGPAFEAFFDTFATRCAATTNMTAEQREAIAAMRTGMIGVRSTGLTTWLDRSERGKRMLCVRDPAPRSLVNASVWGAMRTSQRWVQIGQHRGYDYCRADRSALSELMAAAMMPPKLVIFHLMATDTNRWSSPRRIKSDLRRLETDLPADTACIYFTTAPTYRRSVNKRRVRTQRMLGEAIGAVGSRCQLVNGLTPATLAAFEGNAQFYHRDKTGRVRDPFHPTEAAAKAYLKRHGPALCTAIATALTGTQDRISDQSSETSGN